MVDKALEVHTSMPQELSTGLVIAGAYADKLRRTLFAQLRDRVKQDREFAREVARASGEINRLLFIILVEKLKVDKGDVVRIRVQYDVEDNRIKWYYDTLRIEYFKRVSDEEVAKAVKEVIEERLKEVQEQYAEAPTREEAEKILRGEKEEFRMEETKEIMGKTQPLEKEEIVEEKPLDIASVVVDAAPIGETIEGGLLFELKGEGGENIGIACIESRAGAYVAEAVILPKPGEAYKGYVKLSRGLNDYRENPKLLLEELGKAHVSRIGVDEAREILREKMESLV